MKYLVVQKHDGGCDYTIGCGTRVDLVDAGCPAAAINTVCDIESVEEYGITITVYTVTDIDATSGAGWIAGQKRQYEDEKIADQRLKDEAELLRLSRKLGKV